jgi:hypothetical protein
MQHTAHTPQEAFAGARPVLKSMQHNVLEIHPHSLALLEGRCQLGHAGISDVVHVHVEFHQLLSLAVQQPAKKMYATRKYTSHAAHCTHNTVSACWHSSTF